MAAVNAVVTGGVSALRGGGSGSPGQGGRPHSPTSPGSPTGAAPASAAGADGRSGSPTGFARRNTGGRVLPRAAFKAAVITPEASAAAAEAARVLSHRPSFRLTALATVAGLSLSLASAREGGAAASTTARTAGLTARPPSPGGTVTTRGGAGQLNQPRHQQPRPAAPGPPGATVRPDMVLPPLREAASDGRVSSASASPTAFSSPRPEEASGSSGSGGVAAHTMGLAPGPLQSPRLADPLQAASTLPSVSAWESLTDTRCRSVLPWSTVLCRCW